MAPFAFAWAFVGLVFLLFQALLIALFRGPRHVNWVPPGRCRDFHSWMSAEWRYYGLGGMQIGSRKFGLEVARKGHLRARNPFK